MRAIEAGAEQLASFRKEHIQDVEQTRMSKVKALEQQAAAEQLIGTMRGTSGLNLVVIDAHEIGNFNKKHHMWPTWQRLSQRLTDEVGEGNVGLNIQATDESQIDEAFDKVAGAMQGGAAS